MFSLLDDIVKNYTTTTETKTAIDVARSVVSDVRVLDEAMIKPLEEYIGNTRIADLDKMELLRGYLAAIRR